MVGFNPRVLSRGGTRGQGVKRSNSFYIMVQVCMKFFTNSYLDNFYLKHFYFDQKYSVGSAFIPCHHILGFMAEGGARGQNLTHRNKCGILFYANFSRFHYLTTNWKESSILEPKVPCWICFYF